MMNSFSTSKETICACESIPLEVTYYYKQIREYEGENFGILADKSTAKQYSSEECVQEISNQYSVLASQICLLGNNHPVIATLYNSIASQYIRMREYKKALSCFMMAKDIREKCLGIDHPDTIACYDFIAGGYYLIKDYKTAISWLKLELEISVRLHGEKFIDNAITCAYISKLYDLSGEKKKADEWAGKAC